MTLPIKGYIVRYNNVFYFALKITHRNTMSINVRYQDHSSFMKDAETTSYSE